MPSKMLNLNMFARGGNQPSIDELPIIQEEDDDSSAGGESYDSEYDSTSGYGSSTRTGNDASSTTEALSTTHRTDSTHALADALGMSDAKKICWLRGTVLVALLIATTLLSVIVHHSARRGEFERFESQFGEHSTKIFDALETNLKHGIGEIDNLAVSITSYTRSVNTDWPFAAIPEFDIRAASTRHLAKAALISLVPVVEDTQRSDWESFAIRSSQWIQEGSSVESGATNYQENSKRSRSILEAELEENPQMESVLQEFFASFGTTDGTLVNITNGIAESLYRTDGPHKIVEEHSGPYFPVWQSSPVLKEIVNFNLLAHHNFGQEVQMVVDTKEVVVGKITDITELHDPFNILMRDKEQNGHGPVGTIFFPVLADFKGPQDVVGLLTAIVRWTDYLQAGNLPSEATGIMCVLVNECGQEYSFEVIQDKVVYISEGDLHDDTFDYLEAVADFESLGMAADDVTFSGVGVKLNYCPYTLHVYPSSQVQQMYLTNTPRIYTAIVVIVFALTSFMFVFYDLVVEKRSKKLVNQAVKSHQIVSSLFPAVVRDRLFGNKDEEEENTKMELHPSASRPLERAMVSEKLKLKTFLHTGQHHVDDQGTKPIADLFLKCTVAFADIAGFTAWSSVREPAQVFSLLEAIYAAFDKIAAKRRVFKVETIGDCYVAVTGLPDPQPNHASIMVRFARECLDKMSRVTRKLEVELGPETSDLSFRFGLHSGPVTAGVLRGQKSRFQLFGDTVNTAARMESSGCSDKIHCSEVTANLLIDAGKASWLEPRDKVVEAKGKGTLHTFWVNPRGNTSKSSCSGSGSDNDHDETTTDRSSTGVPSKLQKLSSFELNVAAHKALSQLSPHRQRLVGWTVELLSKQLKGIIAHRRTAGGQKQQQPVVQRRRNEPNLQMLDEEENPPPGLDENTILLNREGGCTTPREEYAESIAMPKFNPNTANKQIDPETIVLSPRVESQLRDYVTTIACSYRENPFHSFDHAGHVTMSVNKILNRIVAAEDCDHIRNHHQQQQGGNNTTTMMTPDHALLSQLHSYTYGITSDPLTHFTCVFAGLIHDVDHPGVSNMQLIKEDDEMATMYHNKSVAEQNSVDLAWELLMDPAYEDLRQCIYTTNAELHHFRNLLVNSVMATDIFDPELMALRNSRWEKAFATPTSTTTTTTTTTDINNNDNTDIADLKATIVIEHIIQASDVAHTMQHWHVYQKWNTMLFEEMYTAFQAGRVEKDPSLGWYKGELWFYDNYIIPLAKKLKECAVFGVASDEFLTYALANRSEWESKGEEIVTDLLSNLLRRQQQQEEEQEKTTKERLDEQSESSSSSPDHHQQEVSTRGTGTGNESFVDLAL